MIPNKTGFEGVKRRTDFLRRKPFYARHKINGVNVHSPSCATAEEAAAWYEKLKSRRALSEQEKGE